MKKTLYLALIAFGLTVFAPAYEAAAAVKSASFKASGSAVHKRHRKAHRKHHRHAKRTRHARRAAK